MRYLLIFTLLLGFGQVMLGQGAYDGPSVIYSNQFFGGGQISTNGWGVQLYSGKYEGFYKVRVKGFELVKLKHPKEFKLQNNGRDNSRRFAYGKLNSFQALRFLIGEKKILSDKIRHGAVAIGYSWKIGPEIGFLKPVYVEVSNPLLDDVVSVERYDPDIHDFSVINGRANFLNGLDKISLAYGVSAKFSALFEYSGENDGIQQVEAGVSLEAFSEKVPIMIEEANNLQFFPSIFISYSIGKKYVKR